MYLCMYVNTSYICRPKYIDCHGSSTSNPCNNTLVCSLLWCVCSIRVFCEFHTKHALAAITEITVVCAHIQESLC